MSPAWRKELSPGFMPVSPSYCPSSPPAMSPLRTTEASSHATRPAYPTSKTYAQIVKNRGLGSVLSGLSGRASSNHAFSGRALSGSDKENGAPGSTHTGMKLFLKPNYAKKTDIIPEQVSTGSIGEALSPIRSDKHERAFTPEPESRSASEAPTTPTRYTARKNRADLRESRSLHDSRSGPGTSAGSAGSGIKLKINFGRNGSRENITVLQSGQNDSAVNVSSDKDAAGRKRSSLEYQADDEDDTDSEIELEIINPSMYPRKKTASPKPKKESITKKTAFSKSKKEPANKKPKLDHHKTDDDNDAVMSGTDSAEALGSNDNLTLMQPTMKRKMRIVDPNNAEDAALIAASTKAGTDIYDSDASDLEGDVGGTNKPQLFRNVAWGPAATDYGDGVTFPTHPEFTQFVPGRWERQPDGSLVDQKNKLIIKLTDKKGNKRIFNNPPPKDWNNQEAITALNKRTVQQIRRNTAVRFREVVTAYVPEERRWILAHLKNGKPGHGWKRFVEEFNQKFSGKVVDGSAGPRPLRSHSSLTKEIERFGPKYYSKGQVPVTVADGDKRKRKSE